MIARIISVTLTTGWWSVSMFTVLLLHLLPVLLYTVFTWTRRQVSFLLVVPTLLLLLSSLGILLPNSGKYVETALEIVIRKVDQLFYLLTSAQSRNGEVHTVGGGGGGRDGEVLSVLSGSRNQHQPGLAPLHLSPPSQTAKRHQAEPFFGTKHE